MLPVLEVVAELLRRGTPALRLAQIAQISVLVFMTSVPTCAQSAMDDVPVYRFETQYVKQWLMLGPMAKNEAFESPETELANPVEGKTVVLKSGATKTWQLVSMDTLKTNSKTNYPAILNVAESPLVYMYCRIESPSNQSTDAKQFYFGSDDHGRVWINTKNVVDSTGPRWHRKFSDPFEAVVPADGLDCLLELINLNGEHSFSLGAGYSFSGRCQCLDGSTPQKDISAALVQGDEVIDATWSAATGRFEFKMVPYNADVHVVLSSAGKQIRWPKRGEIVESDIASDIPLPVAPPTALHRYSAREGFPAGEIETVSEMPDGRIIVGAANVALVFDGQRAGEKFRLNKDCVISDIVVQDDGTTWLATREHGLYRAVAGQVAKRFGEREIGECIYAIALNKSGVLWISSGSRSLWAVTSFRPYFSSDIHQVDRELNIVRQSPGNKTAIIDIAFHPTVGTALAMIGGDVLLMGGEDADAIERIAGWPSLSSNRISSIAFDHSGQLWVNRTNDVGCYQRSGGWNVIPIRVSTISFSPRSRIGVDLKGDVWFTKGKWLFRIQDNMPVFIGKTGATNSMCATRTGGLFLAGSEGVTKVVVARAKRIDHRYGMNIRFPARVKTLGDSVLVSGQNGSAIVDQAGTTHSISTQFVVNSPSGSRYRFAAELSRYTAAKYNSVVSPVEIRPDGSEHEVKTGRIASTYSVCYFSEHLDFGLLGLNGKLYELRGSELTPFDLEGAFPENERPADLSDVTHVPSGPAAGFWLVFDDGRVIRKSSSGYQTFRLPSEDDQSRRFLLRTNGDMLVGTPHGIFRLDTKTGKHTVDSWMRKYSKYAVVDMDESATGMLWIATRNSGIYGIRNGVSTSLNDIPLLKDLHIYDIEVDARDNLWITALEGLHVFTPNATAPTITIESVSSGGKDYSPHVLDRPIDVYPDEMFLIRLAGVDDVSDSTSFRFRIGGEKGLWRQEVNDQNNVFHFRFQHKGLHTAEFQSIDQDGNLSQTVTLLVNTQLRYWQKRPYRTAIALLSILAAAGFGWIIYAFVRHRRDKQNSRQSLLEEQQKARKFAENSAQERIMLLARVCHDLRSPLSIVQLCSEKRFQSELDADDIRNLLSESASQMTYLTDQLLAYSTTENRRELNTEPTEIAGLLDLIHSSVSLRLTDKPTDFRIEIASDAPTRLDIDRRCVTEVLGNLIDNSVKHTPTGLIVLRYELDSAGAPIFCVSDTGVGMDESVIANAFSPFIHSTSADIANRSDTPPGIGLGLSICHGLIEQMGGTIGIRSEIGVGTQVTVSLPQATISTNLDSPQSPPPRQPSPKRVFLVVANAAHRSALRLLLSSSRWICEAGDESTGLDIILRFQPDVVLFDFDSDELASIFLAESIRDSCGTQVTLIAFASQTDSNRELSKSCFDHTVDKALVFRAEPEVLVQLMSSFGKE